jgi:hypothetical protein
MGNFDINSQAFKAGGYALAEECQPDCFLQGRIWREGLLSVHPKGREEKVMVSLVGILLSIPTGLHKRTRAMGRAFRWLQSSPPQSDSSRRVG